MALGIPTPRPILLSVFRPLPSPPLDVGLGGLVPAPLSAEEDVLPELAVLETEVILDSVVDVRDVLDAGT